MRVYLHKRGENLKKLKGGNLIKGEKLKILKGKKLVKVGEKKIEYVYYLDRTYGCIVKKIFFKK